MTVYVQDPDFELHVGDVRDVLGALPDGSADCCITSPPYWGLRDYGADGQLGLEPTPDEYVANMVAVFREVRRVLADHGTLWLNLGDSHASKPPGNTTKGVSGKSLLPGVMSDRYRETLEQGHATKRNTVVGGLKPKNIVGIPWRVAFALQADGWYLRSDIIWAKPNPMPESVTDRPTKAHEYVFLLSKRPRYFFDAEAVREPYTPDGRLKRVHDHSVTGGHENYAAMNGRERWAHGGRNVRSVWEIATQPYPEAHFATYPEELVRRCLLAGCPEWVCGTCGKPRKRILERGELVGKDRGGNYSGREDELEAARANRNHGTPGMAYENTTVGWSDCGHNNYRAGVVLDPFLGSGTTALVARRHGRSCVGIELNETYAELAARRLQQLSLLAEGAA